MSTQSAGQQAHRHLNGIPEIRTFFRTNQQPIYFVGPTAFNLLGIDRWVRNFQYVVYYDSWDGAHPRVFSPKDKPYVEFESSEEINNYLLRDAEVQAFVTSRAGSSGVAPMVAMVFFDEETEQICEELGYELALTQEQSAPDPAAALDDDVGDDLLRLIFTACHPVLSTDARVALTLRLLGGLTTDEIARAFLAPEPTIAQRIVRAKRTLSAKRVPFEVPHGPELGARLSSVLEVIYLIFNEGYSATAGDDWMRPAPRSDARSN